MKRIINKEGKCKHNKVGFCCSCEYGERSYLEYHEQRERDLVDDLKIQIGFKLKGKDVWENTQS